MILLSGRYIHDSRMPSRMELSFPEREPRLRDEDREYERKRDEREEDQ